MRLYQKIYYRIFMLQLPKEKKDNGLLYTYADKKFGVILMDQNFNIKGVAEIGKGYIGGWTGVSTGLMSIKMGKPKSRSLEISKITF